MDQWTQVYLTQVLIYFYLTLVTPCDTVIIWANKTSRRCFWRYWPRVLTLQWSVIKTWKCLALASGKQIGVLGPGKAWAHARSKQTPHCNFPSLKSAICTHLTRRYNATQTSKHLKMRLLPICQMYVAQWSQGDWNEIGGRYPKGTLSIPFFGSNLLQGATKGVSYQCWRDGKGQTVNHILCHGSQIFVQALKFVKKIW